MIGDLSLSPDGRLLAAFVNRSAVMIDDLWQIAQGANAARVVRNFNRVAYRTLFCWSPDGALFATAAKWVTLLDGNLRVLRRDRLMQLSPEAAPQASRGSHMFGPEALCDLRFSSRCEPDPVLGIST